MGIKGMSFVLEAKVSIKQSARFLGVVCSFISLQVG